MERRAGARAPARRPSALPREEGQGLPAVAVSYDLAQAKRWLERLEAAGLDGVIAKKLHLPYLPGSRDGVVKIKPHRTADCVIVGFRWSEKVEGKISTLLLGLYNDEGELDFVGHCSGISAPVQRQLQELLPPLVEPGFISAERTPGGQSRWSRGKELDWNPVRPELVVRGPLRQAREEPLPARHAAHPLPPGQGPEGLHLARGAAAAAPRRPDGRVAPEA